MIADGRVRPIIGARLPIQEAAEAHRLLSVGRGDRQSRADGLADQPSEARARTNWSTSAIVE